MLEDGPVPAFSAKELRCIVEVSDCEIFTHHDAWVVIYHDCENYHDCHVMQTFSVNKQAI